MRDVMINFESFLTRPDAMIRSIGLVSFGQNGLGSELSLVINSSSAMGHTDPKPSPKGLGNAMLRAAL